MRRIALASLVLGSFATAATAEGWKNLVGLAAPEVSATQWLNVSGAAPSLATLKGKVWLLNFIGIH